MFQAKPPCSEDPLLVPGSAHPQVSPSESDDLLGAAPPTVYVDLWPVAALSAVLDVDASGRIAVVHEEATRPVGLLFGVPGSALEGEPLSAVLELPPGRSANDLLSLHGGPKKSNLKTKHKDVAVKVGPVHVLQGLVSTGRRVKGGRRVLQPGGLANPLCLRYRPRNTGHRQARDGTPCVARRQMPS